MYSIAPARPQDLGALPGIELAAATLLAGHAPESVLLETTPAAIFQVAQHEGRVWVALHQDTPVGFAHVEHHDSASLHLAEVDVRPEHGQRGVGARLVLAACRYAAESGYAELTLTTFRDLPWNMPFYVRLGFEPVPTAELSLRLRAIVEDEAGRGLDPARRVVMRRRSAAGPGASPSLSGWHEIRDAVIADLDPLAVVWHDAWHEGHDGLVPTELSVIRTPENFRIRLEAAMAAIRVIGPIGDPLGFHQVREDELYQLFVATAARGSGAAASLIADAEAILRRRGFGMGWLACAIGNHRAARFYQKSGWQLTGIVINEAVTPTGPLPLEVWRYEKRLAE